METQHIDWNKAKIRTKDPKFLKKKKKLEGKFLIFYVNFTF